MLNIVNGMEGFVHVEDKSRKRAASPFWEHTFDIPKNVANRSLLQQPNLSRFGRNQVCLDMLLDDPIECAGCDWNIKMNVDNEVVSLMVYPRPSVAHEIKLPTGYTMTYKVVAKVLNQRTEGDDFTQSWKEDWNQLAPKLRQRPHPIFNLSAVKAQDSPLLYNDKFQLHISLAVNFSYDYLIQPRMAGVMGACFHQLEQQVARLELELKKEKGKSLELQARIKEEASAREQKLIKERDALIAKNKKIAESNEYVVEYIYQNFPKQMQDMNSKIWETTNKFMSTCTDSMHKVQSLMENLAAQKTHQKNPNTLPIIREHSRVELNEFKTIVEAAINPVLQLLANQNLKTASVTLPNLNGKMPGSMPSQNPTFSFPEVLSANYRTPRVITNPDIPKAPTRRSKPLLIDPVHSAEKTSISEKTTKNPFSTNVSTADETVKHRLFEGVSSGIFGIGTPSNDTVVKDTNIFGTKTTGLDVHTNWSLPLDPVKSLKNPCDNGSINRLFPTGGGLFADTSAQSNTTIPSFEFTTAGTGGSKSGSELKLGVEIADTNSDKGLFGNYSGSSMPVFQPIVPSENLGEGVKKTESNTDEPVDITFKPMYQGLEKKEVDTGHKNEKLLFSERSKVFRNLEGSFTERGKGNMEIYKDINKNSARLVLRQEITLKIRLNQAISTMQGLTKIDDKRLRWVNVDFGNPDYNPDEGEPLTFLARFKTPGITTKFYDLCSSFLNGTSTERSTSALQKSPSAKKTTESPKSLLGKSTESPIPLFGKNQRESATGLFGNIQGESASGLFGSNTSNASEIPKMVFSGTTIKPFETGISNGSKAFGGGLDSSDYKFLGSTDKPSAQPSDEPSNITFKPMYEGLEEKTIDPGHANETLLFSERSKVFRNKEGTFTERGKGNLEIYQNNDNKSARMILRQEVTLKIRVHQGMASISGVTKVREDRVRWVNFDFGNTDTSNTEGDVLIFLARFKTAEVTTRFYDLCSSLSKCAQSKASESLADSNSMKENDIVASEDVGKDDGKIPLCGEVDDNALLGTPPVKSLSPEPMKSPVQACAKTLNFMKKPNESSAQNEEIKANMFGLKTAEETMNPDDKKQSESKPEDKLSSIKFTGFSKFEGGSTFGSGAAFGSTDFGTKDSMFSSGIFGMEQSQTNFAEVNPLTGKSEVKSSAAVIEEKDDDDPEKFHMHDQTALFKGQASTGHEKETLIKSIGPAKLYRLDQNQWKARGMGKFQFWQHEEGKIRIVMREDKTEKLRLNHYVDPQLSFQMKDETNNVFSWVGNDYCPEDGGMSEPVSQCMSFSARFRASDTDTIEAFKEMFKSAQQQNLRSSQTQE